MVSQLALAHERNLINKGCALKLTVGNPKDELTRGADKNSQQPATIKIQMIKEGTKDKYVDIDLDKQDNSFDS